MNMLDTFIEYQETWEYMKGYASHRKGGYIGILVANDEWAKMYQVATERNIELGQIIHNHLIKDAS